jgi:hypothetical protein
MFPISHSSSLFFPLRETGMHQRSSHYRPYFALKVALLCVLANAIPAFSAFGACNAPANPIEAENCLPGTPQSQWYIIGTGSTNIQGFSTDISVNAGQTVFFKISTNAISYQIDIYRIGYYGGNGARLVASISPSVPLPQIQPPCLTDAATELTDCGNWAVSAFWAVPSTATSGAYFARLQLNTGEASPVFFVVRNDASHSAILVQTSDPTWQAYNDYGGSSLYTGPAGAAVKVSYNRPLNDPNMYTWFFSAEYPMVRWLEANGYDVSYFAGVDTDRNGALITQHKVFVSNGHDEYWSGGQRANVEAARAAGVNLAFFSGNEIFEKTRWEASIDGTNTPYRTLVCYKETAQNRRTDPQDPPIWTGWWRDPRFSPPADGGRPENALSGTIYWVDATRNDSITVPAEDGKMRFWRNTAIASLAPGQVATLPAGTLGYEWDVDADNGFRPAGLFHLSSTTLTVSTYMLNYNSVGIGTATHHLTLYRAPSGALVFGAGTVQWSWGLDANHAIAGTPTDANMQQATVNLLADMGVQSATLQSGLLPATPSADTIPPRSTITSPTSGIVVTGGSSITVSGTATDFGGGVVGAVEVSVDGGKSWHPAVGRENWNYTFTPVNSGSLNLQSRAVDDSGNLESPSPGITLTAAIPPCPCTIWPSTAAPLNTDVGPDSPIELGVTFRSDISGYITGIRFYKSAANTGVHVGNLWSATGGLLATATFSGESVSGWQQVNFSNPPAIQANTDYVASYHNTLGHYSGDWNYFAAAGTDNTPLHALANQKGVQNGLFTYSLTSAFPTSTFYAANYWVDAVFNTVADPPVAISTTSLPNGTQSQPYSQSLAAGGGTSPYTWSLVSGALPAGLVLSPSGQISGTPTSVGASSFTIRVADSSVPVQTATQALSITVKPSQTPSQANNTELNGNYAFTFNGLTGNNSGSVVFAAVGRFTADGAGNVTNGVLDTNGIGAGAVLTAQSFTGTYAIGADSRGVMTLDMGGGSAKLAFAMMANGNAKFIEFDAAGGSGTIGSGTMEKVDPTAYSTAGIVGDYAFGVAGLDASDNRAALVGRLTSDGAGNFSNGAADINYSGAVNSVIFTNANYTVSDTTSGRGSIQLISSVGGTPQNFNFVFYIVNSGKLFAMQMDAVASSTPLLNGVMLQQQTPAGGFSAASLSAGTVIYMTGRSSCGTGTSPAPEVLVGLLAADGNGGLTLSFDENCGGTLSSYTSLPGTYSVASNGRTTMTVGGATAVAYQVGSDQAFILNTDISVLFGFEEPQAAAGPLNNSAMTGTYAGLTNTPATFGVTVFSGEFTADGGSPAGNLNGTEDIGAPSGPSSGVAFNATYSVSSSPTNGRGTMAITSGSGGNAVIYVLSTSKFVALSLSDSNPAVWIFEQASPATTLSSLTLNPSSVVGGVQSSIGTVTLSGPAPVGGASALLSSSNTAAAQVPTSVTVPAGATSATFTVTSSAVAASTQVTISASYGGVTGTARLTVTPPIVSSLTLNPTSVTGGLQFSTGTVTLNGPAPGGGASALLSSSNTAAAQVPTSVTVQAGATRATFTVTSSAVAASTQVTISASYGGVTGTARLTVTPPIVSSLTLNPTSVTGGLQFSTGTVTLNGPAPGGGASVLLSSSNTAAAQVPRSVTVPAGATSATFPVTTSIVLFSTSADISASYNGTTQTATLAVLL